MSAQIKTASNTDKRQSLAEAHDFVSAVEEYFARRRAELETVYVVASVYRPDTIFHGDLVVYYHATSRAESVPLAKTMEQVRMRMDAYRLTLDLPQRWSSRNTSDADHVVNPPLHG